MVPGSSNRPVRTLPIGPTEHDEVPHRDPSMTRADDLTRICEALRRVRDVLKPFLSGSLMVERKANGDPVTEADHTVNEVLLNTLPLNGDGWLSEETVDDERRLSCNRVWIVDPLDGTK